MAQPRHLAAGLLARPLALAVPKDALRSLLACTFLLATACATPSGQPGPAGGPPVGASARVEPLERFADPVLGIEIAKGRLDLPAGARPRLAPAVGENGVTDVYLVRAEELAWDGSFRSAEANGAPAGPAEPNTWYVFALRRPGAGHVSLELELRRGERSTVSWEIGSGNPGKHTILEMWARKRLGAQAAFESGAGPLQRPILRAAAGAYRLGWSRLELARAGQDGSRGPPSILALFGGRAAVDETLQLDRPLAAREGAGRGAERAIPIDSLPGIEVKAHPWREMLRDRATPRLALADCVPIDRAFLYLAHPAEAVEELEGGGARFLDRVSSFAGQGRVEYSVIPRLLDDLGLGEGLGRRLLRSGAVREAVVFTTDLALLSGTDVTAVAETTRGFLDLLPVPDGAIGERTRPGGKAFTARRGSRVFLSTSKPELERALALHAAAGSGSLGKSDELGFMLLQLAPNERTRAFAYLSDPFIRRLLGPAQRIGQLRQARARAEMEELAGAAFLRRQDAPGETPTVQDLERMNYLEPSFPAAAYSLAADGRVSSPVYGPLDRLWPVSRLDVSRVTAAEFESYKGFREAYTTYWRRFFDPIAVRLDAEERGRYALETFVLPLLDSSFYNGLAQNLARTPSAGAAPRWSGPVPTELALELAEKQLGPLRNLLRDVGLRSEPLLGTLTGRVQFAFPDAAPILQVGGGSVFGFTAADAEQVDGVGLPLAVASLTRPIAIAIEVSDPAEAQRALDGIVPRALESSSFRQVRLRMTRAPDGRILLTVDLFGLATIRLTVRVEGRWLVIANDTALPARLVAGSEARPPASAALTLRPGALRLGLESAWQSFVEADAAAAWDAQGWLAPWLASGEGVEGARASSRAILGAAPVLEPDALVPSGNHLFEHRRYGTRARPLLPKRGDDDFGLFEGIGEAHVQATFEGDGLRTRVTWTLGGASTSR